MRKKLLKILFHLMKMPNKAINSDAKKLRCAPLFGSGYGKR